MLIQLCQSLIPGQSQIVRPLHSHAVFNLKMIHMASNPVMVGVVGSIPIGGNFIFC